jgi:hypothetical protein
VVSVDRTPVHEFEDLATRQDVSNLGSTERLFERVIKADFDRQDLDSRRIRRFLGLLGCRRKIPRRYEL